MDLSGVISASRFLCLIALMLIFGSGLYLGLLPTESASRMGQRLTAVVRIALGIACVAVGVWLPLQAATLGESSVDALNLELLFDVVTGTDAGRVWVIRLALAASLVAAANNTRMRTTIAALMLSSFALTGHAAMQLGWSGIVHRSTHALHLLSGGFWMGALLPLVMGLRAARSNMPAATELVGYFSMPALIAATVVILSGVINALFVLGRLPLEASSPYQLVLLIKIGAVAVMLGLAAVNRFVHSPRISRDPNAVGAIARLAAVEIFLGVAVLALAASLSGLDPT